MSSTFTQHCSRGFTMIELMVVILVIVTMVGLSMGAWSGLLKTNARIAVRGQLANAVRQARSASLSTGRPVQLVIDPDTNRISGNKERLIWRENFQWYDGTSDEQERQDIILHYFDSDVDGLNEDQSPGQLSTGLEGYAWRNDHNVALKPMSTELPVILDYTHGFTLRVLLQIPRDTDDQVIPIVLATMADHDELDNPNVLFGLEWWRQDLFHYVPIDDDNTSDDSVEYDWRQTIPSGKKDPHWALVGWMGERPDDPQQAQEDFFDIDDHIDYWESLANPNNGNYQLPTETPWLVHAITRKQSLVGAWDAQAAGQWLEVSMSWDGIDTFTIARNGEILQELIQTPVFPENFYEADDTGDYRGRFRRGLWNLYIARHQYPTSSTGMQQRLSNLLIDDISISRLRAGEAAPLPSGIRLGDHSDGGPAGPISIRADQGVISQRQFWLFDEGANRDLRVDITPSGDVTVEEATRPIPDAEDQS